MLSVPDNRSILCPSTEISPPVASSRPAITESKVVLPHPLGPTRNVISPNCTSKSPPRSTGVRVSPVTNSFFTCRQATALPGISDTMFLIASSLTSKYDGGFQHQHTANAHQARQNHDHQHGSARACGDLPKQREPTEIEIIFGEFEKRCGHADPDRIPDH